MVAAGGSHPERLAGICRPLRLNWLAMVISIGAEMAAATTYRSYWIPGGLPGAGVGCLYVGSVSWWPSICGSGVNYAKLRSVVLS